MLLYPSIHQLLIAYVVLMVDSYIYGVWDPPRWKDKQGRSTYEHQTSILQHCPKRVNPAPSDMRILVGGFSRSNIFRCRTRPCQLQTTMKQIIQTLNVNTCQKPPNLSIKPSWDFAGNTIIYLNRTWND